MAALGAAVTVDAQGFRYFDTCASSVSSTARKTWSGAVTVNFTIVGDEDPGFQRQLRAAQKYLHNMTA